MGANVLESVGPKLASIDGKRRQLLALLVAELYGKNNWV